MFVVCDACDLCDMCEVCVFGESYVVVMCVRVSDV